ncbi:MAG: esterase-like activity of phytase family protein [Rubrobacteraceae bacterium]
MNRKSLWPLFGTLVLTAFLLAKPVAAQTPETTLEGRAILPAETFAPGPSSGSELGDEEINGIQPPFESQPVQGFSAVLDAGGGSYLAMPDNGFGEKGNSADFLLRLYRITPDFKSARGGSGEIAVEDFIQLRDPAGLIPFGITNEDTPDRLLTGADFDIESVRRDANGDLWFGEEFGPFLLHTDATGELLEAPVPLPGVKSPENPTLGDEEPNLPTSRGFEGMAISDDLATLYPMLEGALESDGDPNRRVIHEFDIETGSYTGNTREYRVEDAENAIGDLTRLGGDRFLVIERDNEEGEAAAFKKVYLVDFGRLDGEGFLEKREVADLLDIEDPSGLSLPAREGDIGVGEEFAFPFQTIESVLPLGDGRLLILNDNNFPFSLGRNPELPDDNEAIVVRSDVLASAEGAGVTARTGGPAVISFVGAMLFALGTAGMILTHVLRQRKGKR